MERKIFSGSALLAALFLCACSTSFLEVKQQGPNVPELTAGLDRFFAAAGKQNVQKVLARGVDEASLKGCLSGSYQRSLSSFSRSYSDARARFADFDRDTLGRTVTDEVNVVAMRPWPYLYVPQTVEIASVARKDEAIVAEIRLKETRWHDIAIARASATMTWSGDAWVLDDLLWLDDPVGKSNRVRIAGLNEALHASSDPATFDAAAKQYR